ncbi:hypothetical protein MMC14_003220 [Varicellaria rhodocarpa]|nr:hypothetical protein [Varicellaria rhodocarpa]
MYRYFKSYFSSLTSEYDMQLHQKLLNEISAVRNQLEEIKAMVLSKPCPDGLDMIWKLSIIILPVIFVLAAFALESRGAQRLSERALRCLEEELLKRKCGEEESKPMGEEGEVFLPSFLSSPLSAFHKALELKFNSRLSVHLEPLKRNTSFPLSQSHRFLAAALRRYIYGRIEEERRTIAMSSMVYMDAIVKRLVCLVEEAVVKEMGKIDKTRGEGEDGDVNDDQTNGNDNDSDVWEKIKLNIYIQE